MRGAKSRLVMVTLLLLLAGCTSPSEPAETPESDVESETVTATIEVSNAWGREASIAYQLFAPGMNYWEHCPDLNFDIPDGETGQHSCEFPRPTSTYADTDGSWGGSALHLDIGLYACSDCIDEVSGSEADAFELPEEVVFRFNINGSGELEPL